MDKKVKKDTDNALFDKLNNAQGRPAHIPVQKTIPVTESKRANKTQTGIWMTIDVIKKLKLIALNENTTITDLVEAGAIAQIRLRDPDFTLEP